MIVASHITFITKKHQLLLANHFSSRSEKTTADALHLLMHKIKEAWHLEKVAAVLFLDIEGAFPNVVPTKLIHNLRK